MITADDAILAGHYCLNITSLSVVNHFEVLKEGTPEKRIYRLAANSQIHSREFAI